MKRDGGGIRFFYAIADVASFVAHAGALDDEAHRRGRTIYAPDRRIPLHPTSLSEEAASLLPDRERPAFVWEFRLDVAGRVTSTSVGRARIRSRRQLDYVPVQAAIDAGTADEQLRLLREVGEARLVLERERGGASLNVPRNAHRARRRSLSTRSPRGAARREVERPALAADHGRAARLMLDGGVGILRTMATADEAEFDWFRLAARTPFTTRGRRGSRTASTSTRSTARMRANCRSCTPPRRCSDPRATRGVGRARPDGTLRGGGRLYVVP